MWNPQVERKAIAYIKTSTILPNWHLQTSPHINRRMNTIFKYMWMNTIFKYMWIFGQIDYMLSTTKFK